MVGINLPEIVDNRYFSSVNTFIGGNLFFLELYILRYVATRRPRTARYKTHSDRAQLAHNMVIV